MEYSGNSSGPINEANQLCLDSEAALNQILLRCKSSFPVDPIDFSNNRTLTLNEDVDHLFFTNLKDVPTDKKLLARQVKEECENYIESQMLPKLLKLEFIILLQAFTIKGKPIIDLFYTFNNEVRVMRDPKDFCCIMGGGFMALFYKLVYMILIRKVQLDSEYTEIFNVLQENKDPSIPSNSLFGDKVFRDCSVSAAVFSNFSRDLMIHVFF